MKHLILTIGLCLSAQFIFANNHLIQPRQDTLPNSDWSFGVQGGIFYNNHFSEAYHLGMFAEHRFSSLFAFEAELSGEYKMIDRSFFGGYKFDEINLDVVLNFKLYFGRDRRWYAKVGYFQSHNLFNNFLDNYPEYSFFYTRSIMPGLQSAVGHNFHQKNNSVIRLEGLLRYNSVDGLSGGLKLGFTF